MTNDPRDLEDDELISAYLDNEVSSADRARVEADPALTARAQELASVVMAPASASEALPDDVRDRFVESALAAWRDQQAVVSPSEHSTASGATNLVDLSARRKNRLAMTLSAAAVVALLAMSGSVAARLLSSGDDDSTSQATAAGDFEAERSTSGRATAEESRDDADANSGSADSLAARNAVGDTTTRPEETSDAASDGRALEESAFDAEAGDPDDAAADDTETDETAADDRAADDSAAESSADEPALASEDEPTTSPASPADDGSDAEQATMAEMAVPGPRDLGVVLSPLEALEAMVEFEQTPLDPSAPADQAAVASWQVECAPVLGDLDVVATARLTTTDLVVIVRAAGTVAPAGSLVALSATCEVLDSLS